MHSSVYFSSGNEVDEPWRLPSSRGEGRMDPDPEGDKEGERGAGWNEGISNTDDDEEETPRGQSSPFLLKRRRRSPGPLPPMYSPEDDV